MCKFSHERKEEKMSIKERPILMSGDMVRAILAGSKRQTRRIIKCPLPEYLSAEDGKIVYLIDKLDDAIFPISSCDLKRMIRPWVCKYGDLGDRLWLRETISINRYDEYVYKADFDVSEFDAYEDGDGGIWFPGRRDLDRDWKWIPSRHMPRRFSRITLEITGKKVEHLQDISEEDAIAEGVLFNPDHSLYWDYEREQWICIDAVDSFRTLINKISGAGTWDSNPLVRVVEFQIFDVKGGYYE